MKHAESSSSVKMTSFFGYFIFYIFHLDYDENEYEPKNKGCMNFFKKREFVYLDKVR